MTLLLLLLVMFPATVAKQSFRLFWTQFNIFTGDTPDYATWALRVDLRPGDDIVFLFFPEYHDVCMLASKENFLNCNFTSSIRLTSDNTRDYIWTVPGPGTYYFSCSQDSGAHCELGQKFAITVGEHEVSHEVSYPPAPGPDVPAVSGLDGLDDSEEDCDTDPECWTIAAPVPSVLGSSDASETYCDIESECWTIPGSAAVPMAEEPEPCDAPQVIIDITNCAIDSLVTTSDLVTVIISVLVTVWC